MITETERMILERGLNNELNISVYEIMAKYGEMEKTSNGFKNLDARTILDRIKRLLK